MSETTLSEDNYLQGDGRRGGKPARLGLMIAWSLAEPWRVGEVAVVPAAGAVLGRGGPQPDDDGERLVFAPLRPGRPAAGAPPGGKSLSRIQWRVRPEGDSLRISNLGKAPLWHEGKRVDDVIASVGDRLYIEQQMLLLCVERHADLNARGEPPAFAFGDPDAFGLVGEGVTAWRLRDQLGFCARREGHVLITGPSGAGKELAARALHGLSPRSKRPFVARNAATIPAGIADAELFGNARNYPNPGMRERLGLVGEADGGTLFLDEIGELPEPEQARLLRLLDEGQYHRLGDDRASRADVRVIAATNRDPSSLKHDLLARFALRLSTPGLQERREDVPLLIRALLRGMAARDAEIAARFASERGEVRVDPLLIEALLGHQFSTHLRELSRLLLLSMSGSAGAYLALTDEVREVLRGQERERPPPSVDEIRLCLERLNGNVSLAWKELGLSSRDALRRLIRKHGIEVERP